MIGKTNIVGKPRTVPVLNGSYPADVTGKEVGSSATFEVKVATDGYPAEYTYQWYVNGSAVSGATGASYTRSKLAMGTYTVYCMVTNKAGTTVSRTAKLTVTKQYLFRNGAFETISGLTRTNASQSISSGVITLTASSRSTYSLARSTEKVDLSSAKTLYIKFNSGSKTYRYSGGAYVGFGVTTATPSVGTDGGSQYKVTNSAAWKTFAHTENNNAQPSGTLSLDVSGVATSGYIVILFDSMEDYFNGVMKISEIRLEG